MTMITPSYLGETIEYSSLHACRSTLEDPTNSGIGSNSLNADVNAFERLQMVRDRNSSYFGSKYKSCTVRARSFGTSSLPSTNAS